jgi:hypothetical protein
MRLKLGIQG